MRVLYFTNNRLGWQVLEWLRQRRTEIVGLVVHPPERRLFGEEILAAANLEEERIFDATELERPEVLDRIRELEPDIGVSVLLAYILRPTLLDILPKGCINLHPALLPHNRGVNTNVWALVDRTPAGVSLHWMDKGLDTGDLIGQREVEVEPVDTGKSLYRKLEGAGLSLFQVLWPEVEAGRAPRHPQPAGSGSFHRRSDLRRLDRIDLDETTTARRLIDILRARTFPPYGGAYFVHEGRKVFLRLELSYEEEAGQARSEDEDD